MADSNRSSRRRFLKLSGVAGAASVLPVSAQAAAEVPAVGTATGRAKNLIFLVVDGMSHGTLGLAQKWMLRHRQQPLHYVKLFERADLRRSLMDTASASSPVTDSAAAASAWGCGQRVMNGAICMAADGQALKPLMSHAKAGGKRTGLVTTCEISHATPAGFAANVANRGQQNQIVRQYLERGVDVLLGGGSKHFNQRDEGGEVDVTARFRDAGYEVVGNCASLAAASGSGPLLGLFSESHLPYAIDRENEPGLSEVPGLPEMFRAALKRLAGSEDGFALQVEAGRVDHAGHANDPGAILHELLEFDACIPIALEFIEQHPDTLLVVTTDHGTGGCQLDGLGDNYAESGPALDRINRMKYSFEWLQYQCGSGYKPELIEKAFGITPTLEQSAMIEQSIQNRERYLSGALLRAFGGHLRAATAVGWSSQMHTAECVDLLAFGSGAEGFPPVLDNNEVFGVVTKALGIA